MVPLIARITLIFLIAAAFPAAASCVLQERSVSQSQVTITERGPIQREVVNMPNGQRRCIVNFRVLIGADWYWATGDVVWAGSASPADACMLAVRRAEDEVSMRVGQTQVAADKVMICRDDEMTDPALSNITVGTRARLQQFRMHPDRPNQFYHGGTICRYALDTVFAGSGIQTHTLIICWLRDDEWVVEDRWLPFAR